MERTNDEYPIDLLEPDSRKVLLQIPFTDLELVYGHTPRRTSKPPETTRVIAKRVIPIPLTAFDIEISYSRTVYQ